MAAKKNFGTKDADNARVAAWIDADLLAEVRGALNEVAPRVTGGGMSAFLALALTRELERLRKKHNGGKAFSKLPPGSMRPGPRSS
jgi:hypothetical protein